MLDLKLVNKQTNGTLPDPLLFSARLYHSALLRFCPSSTGQHIPWYHTNEAGMRVVVIEVPAACQDQIPGMVRAVEQVPIQAFALQTFRASHKT